MPSIPQYNEMFVSYNDRDEIIEIFGLAEYLMGCFEWKDSKQHTKCLNYFLKFIPTNTVQYNLTATLGWGLSTLYINNQDTVKLHEDNGLKCNRLLTQIYNYPHKFRLCLQYQENQTLFEDNDPRYLGGKLFEKFVLPESMILSLTGDPILHPFDHMWYDAMQLIQFDSRSSHTVKTCLIKTWMILEYFIDNWRLTPHPPIVLWPGNVNAWKNDRYYWNQGFEYMNNAYTALKMIDWLKDLIE